MFEVALIVSFLISGSGKSKLITDISTTVEHLLRKTVPGNLARPHVLKTAFTGIAAINIDGSTLHSSLHLPFGNAYQSLPDEKRDQLRDRYQDLKILIIDEVSMIKSDMLYQIHLRLQELKCSSDKLFGGVSVLLFGDLMQLRPVQGDFVFAFPKNKQFETFHVMGPLLDEFTVINLVTNHRQGEDHTYAELLSRLRFGEHTKEDIELLKTRILGESDKKCNKALFIYGTNKACKGKNEDMMNGLPGQVFSNEAKKIPPLAMRSYKFSIGKDDTIDQTSFVNTLHVKIGARLMLIHNIDSGDRLTNGQRGTLVHVQTKTIDGKVKVQCLIVEFDDPNAGTKQRQQHPGCKKWSSTGVPIFEFDLMCSITSVKKSHGAKAKIIQFPVKLCWAITAHKVQGMFFIIIYIIPCRQNK